MGLISMRPDINASVYCSATGGEIQNEVQVFFPTVFNIYIFFFIKYMPNNLCLAKVNQKDFFVSLVVE